MARIRPSVAGGIAAGARTLLGQLAQFFRLGRLGAIPAGTTAQAGRPRLETAQEVVAELQREHAVVPAAQGTRWAWSYLCIWTDTTNGERVGAVRQVIETPAGTAYQTVAAQARRLSFAHLPGCVQAATNAGTPLRLTCRRLGTPLVLPSS